jgi:hypothetical protein
VAIRTRDDSGALIFTPEPHEIAAQEQQKKVDELEKAMNDMKALVDAMLKAQGMKASDSLQADVAQVLQSQSNGEE